MRRCAPIKHGFSCFIWVLPAFTCFLGAADGTFADDPAVKQPVAKIAPIEQLPRIELAPIDLNQVLAEDETRPAQGLPPRFAIPYPVQITPATDGLWETLPNGARIWRLRVLAPRAVSINLGFGRYAMPPGGLLYLHAADNSDSIRPFTANDNADHGQLWTPPIRSNDIIIEVTVPDPNAEAALDLELTSINYGYREFGAILAAARSGSCNIDVVCPQGAPWQDEIPAIAVYSTGGSLFCTGFMVNNTANDETPYFMTANHCGIGSGNAPSLVVFWNFETSTCGGNPNGSLSQFQSGATWRASYSPSDFTLVELSQSPNPAWNITFAGWDRTSNDPTSAVCIHHPNTDEKRISFENNPTVTTSWGGTSSPGDGSHIRVIDWDLGTTEPGSSGSPLFDQNHHVVGQLHGGSAACGNNLSDWFGRFSTSWNGGGSPSSRLKDWLDPGNTGVLSVDTLLPGGGPVCGNGIVEPGEQCDPPGPGCDANCQFSFPDCNNNGRDDAEDIACGAGNVCGGIPGSADCNLNGVPDECEGTVVLDYPITVSPPLNIPDGSGSFVSHTFNVPDSGIIADLDLDLTINHTWNGDLIVRLSHGGTTVVVIDRPGYTGSGFGFGDDGFSNILLDDEGAGGSIENASTGGPALTSPPSYVPNNPLSAFDGMQQSGVWTIEVSDNASQDTGTLNAWSPHITDQGGAVQCVGACCLVDGTCQVLTQADCGLNPGAIYQGDETTCTPNPCTAPCQGPADGDVSLDSVVNGADVDAFVSAMFGGPTPDEVCHGDFNGSGDLDSGDVSGLVTALLGP
ncbi:MAG: proprotein convertase P-domain-containing protein [Phycisphaerae bacterium]